MRKRLAFIIATIALLVILGFVYSAFEPVLKPSHRPENHSRASAQASLSLVQSPVNTNNFLSNSNNNISVATTAGQIGEIALRQIAAIEAEKDRRTPAQLKIDSQLLYADRMRRGLPIAEGVATQTVVLDTDETGRVLVDIRGDISPSLIETIVAMGGRLENSFPEYHSLRASITLASVENLARRPDIQFIQPAVRMIKNSVDSEGDFAHQATNARAAFGVNGSGVKVGVLSDSVDGLTNSQVGPFVTVLPGLSGSPATGEGVPMLEIVHDLAPGAPLYFATASGGTAALAANILQLKAAGCNIIVDDILYANESPFQDAMVAQAVNTVTASGALYFASAGDSANKDHGFSGTWEGDFVDGGQALAFGEAGRLHSFGTQNFNTVSTGLGALRMDFFWSDPLGASTNDYDVFVLNSTGTTVVASSTNPQTGTQDPYEYLGTLTSGQLIVILKKTGVARFLHLETGRGRLGINTAGNTRGHNCASNAFNIAAVDAALAGGGTNAFSGGAVEIYSSDGPRRVFYQADGTPITSGNFSSSGGSLRQKPDFAAADDVSTDSSYFFFNPFRGTSAAAPHAAAIAALLESYNPSLTPAQLRSILTSSALDNEAAGVDRDAGYGIVMALAALRTSPKPPLILRGSIVSNQFNLSFTSVVGQNYTIQYSPALNTNSWTTLTQFTAITTNGQALDSLTNAPRFYRVFTTNN